jgi:hypothetical protein
MSGTSRPEIRYAHGHSADVHSMKERRDHERRQKERRDREGGGDKSK